MSWTKVCDLTMVVYQGQQVLDSTSFGNHAAMLGSVIPQQEFVSFMEDDAQLEVVGVDDSFARFAGLRVQALVRPQAITRRYDIAEGWMSFALVIEADGRLHGTIYDGQDWVGPDSGAVTVSPDQWSRVCFEFDGVSTATVALDGATVGRTLGMPLGMHQPQQQVIALGHWPRGDGSYTLRGDLGHVRIERRDYANVIADATAAAHCRRRLSPAQASAQAEMAYLFSMLPDSEQNAIRACAKAQYEASAQLTRDLRSLEGWEASKLCQLGETLRSAWCCTFDSTLAREALESYLGSLFRDRGTARNDFLLTLLEKFFAISHMCERSGWPYDRIAELRRVLFPELVDFEKDLRHLAEDL